MIFVVNGNLLFQRGYVIFNLTFVLFGVILNETLNPDLIHTVNVRFDRNYGMMTDLNF